MENNFKNLKKYNKVIVTGCQRSGTRFFGKAVANDTGKRYVDEKEFSVHDVGLFKKKVKGVDNIVIHCPAMASYLRFLIKQKIITKKDLIIWCYRNKKDVFASMKRIGWDGTWEEAKYYNLTRGEDIQDVKNRWWSVAQNPYLKAQGYAFKEVNYEDYEAHETFLNEKERRSRGL